jgi:mRNA interferase MazF
MNRGDVYWAVLNPTQGSEQSGTRPVIIVSRDAINRFSSVVVVVPLTDSENKPNLYPSQVLLSKGEGGLDKESVALGEQIRAIAKTRLRNQIGHLSSQRMAEVAAALKVALDL